MLQIGIRSSSFLNSQRLFTPKELDFLGCLGFDLVELNFNHPQTGIDYSDARMGEAFREQALRSCMRLLAHAPTNYSLTSPDKAHVAQAVEEYKNVLDGLRAYGIKSMVVHADVYLEIVPGREDEQKRNLVSSLCRLADKCERDRICLYVETMIPGRITSSMDNIITAVDAVGSPWIDICLDTNHLPLSEELAAAALRAGKRIGELHANDNHGEHEEHLLPYAGVVDWRAFAEAVRVIGFDGDIIMEPSWKPGDDQQVMIRQAHTVAQRLLGEIDHAGM